MQISSDIIRGHLDGIILKLLIEKDCYGYEIAALIKAQSADTFTIKEATLYAVVQRLEKREMITSYIGTKSKGGQRRYYKITTFGKAYFKEKLDEWKTLKTLMAQLMEDDNESN